MQRFTFNTFGWLKRAYTVVISALRNIRSRKTVVLFVIIGFLFLYLASSYLLPAHRHFHSSHVQQRLQPMTCLDRNLQKWNKLMENNDAVFKIIPESTKENQFFPFAGNGYIGISVSKKRSQFYLFINHEWTDSLTIPTLSYNLVESSSEKQTAIILSIKDGSIVMLTSFLVNKSCILVEELYYLHRLHADIFSHEITISNEGLLPVTLKFTQNFDRSGNFHSSKMESHTSSGNTRYTITQGTIEHPRNSREQVKVTVCSSDFQPTVRVPQKGQNRVNMISTVGFKVIEKENDDVRKRKAAVILSKHNDDTMQNVVDRLLDVSNVLSVTLYKQHVDAWNDLWKVGVQISSDIDPDSPSALHVNLTIYYIYSSAVYNRSKATVSVMNCFNGPPTLHSAELWVVPLDINRLQKLTNTWSKLFKESNCIEDSSSSDLLQLREAMVLSFLGLQYRKQYLQLALNPINLRSNISVHGLSLDHFHSQDTIDLMISVNRKTSERTMLVTCAGNHNPVIYGCSTPCESVVTLGGTALNFPVHTTDPVTPLFYISTNRTCLERIGDTPYMKRAKENAKSLYQSNLEVHHFKLSPKFWLAVVILIVTFHVVVIKMIYNECRKNHGVGRRRGQFNS